MPSATPGVLVKTLVLSLILVLIAVNILVLILVLILALVLILVLILVQSLGLVLILVPVLVSILVQSLGTNLLLREFGTTATSMMTSLLLNTLAIVLFQDTVLMVSNSKKKKGSLTVFMMDIMISFQAASSFCFGFGIVLTSPYG